MKRVVGQPVLACDLATALFPIACEFPVEFKPGDLCLCPRSSGGFSYGEILGSDSSATCLDSSSYRHPPEQPYRFWKVAVDALHQSEKRMPHGSLGKLTLAEPIDTVIPATSVQRLSGENASLADLGKVQFNRKSAIAPGNIVLVPKSRGGLVYGLVVDAVTLHKCSSGLKHTTPFHGFRVYITEGTVDMPTSCLGFLGISDPTFAYNPSSGSAASLNRKAALAMAGDMGKHLEELQTTITPAHADSVLKLLSQQEARLREEDEDGDVDLDVGNESTLFAGRAPAAVNAPAMMSLFQPPDKKAGGGAATVGTSAPAAGGKGVIVVDAANVAISHGKAKKFSCKGIQIVINFYREKGYTVVAFLPQYYLSTKIAKMDAKHKVDDMKLLQSLVDQELLVLTPSQDYDDSYSIEYARKHNGMIISNDIFRDHNDKEADMGEWLKQHCISYTFVADEFLPNPDRRI